MAFLRCRPKPSAALKSGPILGLPLMNNYYVVFDRSLDPPGVIGFAAIRH